MNIKNRLIALAFLLGIPALAFCGFLLAVYEDVLKDAQLGKQFSQAYRAGYDAFRGGLPFGYIRDRL